MQPALKKLFSNTLMLIMLNALNTVKPISVKKAVVNFSYNIISWSLPSLCMCVLQTKSYQPSGDWLP